MAAYAHGHARMDAHTAHHIWLGVRGRPAERGQEAETRFRQYVMRGSTQNANTHTHTHARARARTNTNKRRQQAYEERATKKGLYSLMDKIIKTGSRIAISISEKI